MKVLWEKLASWGQGLLFSSFFFWSITNCCSEAYFYEVVVTNSWTVAWLIFRHESLEALHTSPQLYTGLSLRLTFVHSHPTVVTLDNLICILAVVSQTDAADEDVLSAPGLGPVQQGILVEKS